MSQTLIPICVLPNSHFGVGTKQSLEDGMKGYQSYASAVIVY